jgi:hypothetical protein
MTFDIHQELLHLQDKQLIIDNEVQIDLLGAREIEKKLDRNACFIVTLDRTL